MQNREHLGANAFSVIPEFVEVDLGDTRLNSRVLSSVAKLANDPSASYPKVFTNERDLEGWYRLLRNERSSGEALLGPHVVQTWTRCRERKVVLALADTTSFHFSGEDTRAG